MISVEFSRDQLKDLENVLRDRSTQIRTDVMRTRGPMPEQYLAKLSCLTDTIHTAWQDGDD